MTTNRYDDELLSAIIDGEASAEQVASVEADADARQRLAAMAAAVEGVAAPVPPATPERRSASIAAAMAAATPASPEVTSLSAKRHERDVERKRKVPAGWLVAAAAAVLLFVLGIPLLFNIGGADSTDFATSAAETTETTASGAVDATDSVTSDDDDAEEEEEEAMEDEEEEVVEEAMEDEEEVVEEALEDEEEEASEESDIAASAPADDAAGTSNALALDLAVVTSVDELNELVSNSIVTPELTGEDILSIETFQARNTSNLDEVLATEVNPECLNAPEGTTDNTPYSLVVLDPFAGAAQLVVVEFGNDGTTRLLNSETCAVIG